jgi:heptosyltransferase-3
VTAPLVIRFGALGDMVLLIALLRTLFLRFGTRIDVVLAAGSAPALLEGQPCIGNVFELGTRKLPTWLNPQFSSLVRRLRDRGPGPVWICQTDELSHSLAERAGYDPDWVITQRDYPGVVGEHNIDRYLRMGNATPRALSTPRPLVRCRTYPQLLVPPAAFDETRAWLAQKGVADRPLVLIQAGNKRTMYWGLRQRRRNTKYWPESHWAEVIDRIHTSTPDAAILLLGVSMERPLNRAILERTRTSAAIDVAGEVPISRLMALCSQALAMVSVDTGPGHVAAAVGCPVVVLFGTQDPNVYAPVGENARVEVVTGNSEAERPMLTIEPEAVMAAWERLRPSQGRCADVDAPTWLTLRA